MKTVLLIEDSLSQAALQISVIRQRLNYPVKHVKSKKELEETLKESHEEYFAAIVDMMLPDAMHGEALDVVLEYKIPPIIYTAIDAVTLREELQAFHIVDYVTKSDISNFEYVLKLLKFIYEYGKSKILIVDDSQTSRGLIHHALDGFGFQLLEADNADMTLKILEEHHDVLLVIVKKELPDMNGLDLIRKLRSQYDDGTLHIMGVSSSENVLEAIQFIKSGANDFIKTPFINEELILRVMNNIEVVSLIHAANERAIRDFMTKMYNRKYLFEDGAVSFNRAMKKRESVVLAMIDIDHFKKINDEYGHPVGDRAIILLANLLKDEDTQAHFAARIGGEEFLLMWIGKSLDEVTEVVKTIMDNLKDQTILSETGKTINLTISVGMVQAREDDLETTLLETDKALYKAKEAGRNRICYL